MSTAISASFRPSRDLGAKFERVGAFGAVMLHGPKKKKKQQNQADALWSSAEELVGVVQACNGTQAMEVSRA